MLVIRVGGKLIKEDKRICLTRKRDSSNHIRLKYFKIILVLIGIQWRKAVDLL